MMFFKKNGGVEYLIVGLGNPGLKYEMTRHNTGFLCLDKLAEDYGISICKLKNHALCGRGKIEGHECLLIKPNTFMNESGKAVAPFASFYKIPPEKIIILCDDIYQDVGKLRIRTKGSAGGHNGLKSIISSISSEDFPRIRIGCGKKPDERFDLADFVLSRYRKEEYNDLKKSFENACEAIKLIVSEKTPSAMERYNRR